MPNSPESYLFGAYAYAYSGHFHKPQHSLIGTEQSFAGYIIFDGKGGLHGAGQVNLFNFDKEFNLAPVQVNGALFTNMVNFTGQYKVTMAPVPTGTLQQVDANDPTITIDYYFVMANDWQELKFMIAKTGIGKMPIVAGTMKRVYARTEND